jgi:hypothetical protein
MDFPGGVCTLSLYNNDPRDPANINDNTEVQIDTSMPLQIKITVNHTLINATKIAIYGPDPDRDHLNSTTLFYDLTTSCCDSGSVNIITLTQSQFDTLCQLHHIRVDDGNQSLSFGLHVPCEDGDQLNFRIMPFSAQEVVPPSSSSSYGLLLLLSVSAGEGRYFTLVDIIHNVVDFTKIAYYGPTGNLVEDFTANNTDPYPVQILYPPPLLFGGFFLDVNLVCPVGTGYVQITSASFPNGDLRAKFEPVVFNCPPPAPASEPSGSSLLKNLPLVWLVGIITFLSNVH